MKSSLRNPSFLAHASGPFSFAPASAVIGWDDKNGRNLTGNLKQFRAHADKDTITFLRLDGLGLTAITGLRHLPQLQLVLANDNSLTSLDIRRCPKMDSIELNNNQLSNLDLSKSEILESLKIAGNRFTTLDISKCPMLNGLDGTGNQLPTSILNTIFSQIDAFGLNGGFLTVSGQTPSAPLSDGPPDGNTARSNLIDKGWRIETD